MAGSNPARPIADEIDGACRVYFELGLWPNWIRQRPFKPPIVSSNLTGPMMFLDGGSRSSIGRAAGLYPASAGLARDPSSNLGGSIKLWRV
jgi:hypothetical protein